MNDHVVINLSPTNEPTAALVVNSEMLCHLISIINDADPQRNDRTKLQSLSKDLLRAYRALREIQTP